GTGHAQPVPGVALVAQGGGAFRDRQHQGAGFWGFAAVLAEAFNFGFNRDITLSGLCRAVVFGPELFFEQVGHGGVVDVFAADVVGANGRVQDGLGAGAFEEVGHQVVGVVTG